MPEEDKKNRTVKIPIIISIAISIAVIIIILFFTIDADTIQTLRGADIKYEFFIIAVLLNVLFWILWGARLKVIANKLDKKVDLSLIESTKIVIANLFLASITPSMAGGEPVRIYLLNKKGMTLGCATASVIGERLVDAIFVLILVPIALFIVHRETQLDETISTALLIGIVVFISFLVIFLYAISKPEKTKRFLIWINKKITKITKKKESESKAIKRISTEVDNFHKGIILFKQEGRITLVKAGILTALSWTSGFMIPSMLLMGLGMDPHFLLSYTAQVLLLIIVMMPTTPGSTGVAEGGIFLLYDNLSIISRDNPLIGVFVLLFRFITYHMNLIVGTIFFSKVFKSITSFSMDKIKRYEEEKKIDNDRCNR